METSTVNDWDTNGPEEGVSVKSFGSQENTFYKEITNFKPINKQKFLKKQYKRRYFILELRLNDDESIYFHQCVTAGYQTNFKKLQIKWFEEQDKIDVVDYKNSFTVDTNFDFVSYVNKKDPQECYSIIQSLKEFEDLFGLVELYKAAYEEVKKIACVDLSILGEGTEDCWRKCASLLKFGERDVCLDRLTTELLAGKPTLPKRFLESKDIKHEIRNGQPVLIPENSRQLKVIIKILSDKLVNTYFGNKDGLSDRIETI